MPKVETFDLVVPGTPAEVAARLRAVTRFRLFTYRPSLFGKGGLGGRVDERSFTVADDAPRVFQFAQAVATGTLEPEGDGATRVRGRASLPGWLTWQLRLVFLALVSVSALLLVFLASSAGAQPWQVVVAALLYGAAALFGGGVAIGMNVANADAGVAPLVDRLRETLAPPAADGVAAAAPARQPAPRQTEG